MLQFGWGGPPLQTGVFYSSWPDDGMVDVFPSAYKLLWFDRCSSLLQTRPWFPRGRNRQPFFFGVSPMRDS